MTLTICPYCKESIESDSIYCDQCGQHLMVCTSCGAFAKGAHCTKCGGKTILAGTQPAAAPAPSVSVPTPAPAPAPTPAPSITQPVVQQPVAPQVSGEATVRPGAPQPKPGHLVCMSTGLRLLLADQAVLGRRGSYGDALSQFVSISGRHAQFHQLPDGNWQIMDIGSSYGTFMGGIQLQVNVPHPIKVGDVIRFANIDFIVQQ